MNEQAAKKPFPYIKYGLFLGSFGLFSCFFLFPTGIYSGFFCGLIGLVCSLLGRSSASIVRGRTLSVVLCILSLLVSLVFFASMLSFYHALNDPIAGAEVTAVMLRLLEQSGISVQEFLRMMSF